MEPLTPLEPESTPAPAPATAGAALAAGVADDNAAASAQAAASLKSAVDALAESIRSGKASIDAAASAAAAPARPTPEPVAPTPTFTPETLATMCEQAGLPRQAAGVFVEFAKNVVLPVYAGQITQAAKAAKREAERDPETGPLMKRFGPQVEKIIKERGITDAYLAEHGYGDLARLAASADPAYFEERVAAAAAARTPQAVQPAVAPSPGSPAVSPRPPVEGVAPTTASTPGRRPSTRDEAIAAVQVSREEVDLHRDIFRMTEGELKKQKYEIEEWKRELGPVGLKKAGGIPICRLEEIFPGAVREE